MPDCRESSVYAGGRGARRGHPPLAYYYGFWLWMQARLSPNSEKKQYRIRWKRVQHVGGIACRPKILRDAIIMLRLRAYIPLLLSLGGSERQQRAS